MCNAMLTSLYLCANGTERLETILKRPSTSQTRIIIINCILVPQYIQTDYHTIIKAQRQNASPKLKMKTFILSTLLATVLASPAPAPVEATAALTSCVVGQVYCGWYLIDQLGESLRLLSHLTLLILITTRLVLRRPPYQSLQCPGQM
jgi:hypothetical protein